MFVLKAAGRPLLSSEIIEIIRRIMLFQNTDRSSERFVGSFNQGFKIWSHYWHKTKRKEWVCVFVAGMNFIVAEQLKQGFKH